MGFVLPRMLVLCVVVDSLLRFAPVAWRPMEGGEAAIHHRVYGEAYARNFRSEGTTGYGDLSRIGNLKTLREYRAETFTTDERGFRNGPRSAPAAAVLFGDSFAVSGGNTNTLAEQLSRIIGCDVYNAAAPDTRFQLPGMSLVESVTARIHLRGGFVIMERI